MGSGELQVAVLEIDTADQRVIGYEQSERPF